MARRPGDAAGRARVSKRRSDPLSPNDPSPSNPQSASPANDHPAGESPTGQRGDELRALLEHCTAAQVAANALGERFLAYLLAMAMEEVRAALRQTTPVIKESD